MKTSSNIFEIPVRSHGVMRLIPGAAPSRHWLSIAILALAAFISYCLFVDASLYADDWYIIWRIGAEPGWVLTGPDIARPLELLAFSIVKNFFGINPLAWRLTLIMLQWLSACLLYMLFVWLMPERRWSALACSLLFLLYPSVLTHTWLAFLNQTVVVCLTLGYALLVVHYIKRGSLVSLAGALFLLLISLLMYEAQLGLAALWGLIVLLIFPQIAWKRRLTALCAILLLCVPYAAWRAYMAGQVANGAVKYSLAEPVSPFRIIGRLLLGARIQLWAFSEPVRLIWPGLANGFVLLLIFAVVALAWVAGWLWLYRHQQPGANWSKWPMAPDRTTVVLCAAAPLLLVAGLIPTIVYWDPTLDGILTRVSYFSTLGAALGAVALLALGTGSVIRGGRNADILVAFASAPLILLAAFTQLRTEATYAAVWVEQKDLWTQMVELIPALAPNSSVFFVMPGYEDRFGFTNYSRTPILDSLDAKMALRVVYGDEQLAGDVLYPGVNVSTAPVLAPAGVMHWWHKDVTPYDQAVFVIYAGAPRRLQIVRDLSVVADIDFVPSTYQPLQRILPSPVGVPPLRSVIYAGPGPQSRD